MNSNPTGATPHSNTSEVLGKRLGSLQQFQSRIAQRIAQAQAQDIRPDAMLSLSIQGKRLLVPLTHINELLSKPELTHVPLAKQWVLGLAVVRAEVLTVFDLDYCLSAALKQSAQHTALIDLARDKAASMSSTAQ
jgi:chemotaxis signal transduction protein